MRLGDVLLGSDVAWIAILGKKGPRVICVQDFDIPDYDPGLLVIGGPFTDPDGEAKAEEAVLSFKGRIFDWIRYVEENRQ